jgi:hypothetical protein
MSRRGKSPPRSKAYGFTATPSAKGIPEMLKRIAAAFEIALFQNIETRAVELKKPD